MPDRFPKDNIHKPRQEKGTEHFTHNINTHDIPFYAMSLSVIPFQAVIL